MNLICQTCHIFHVLGLLTGLGFCLKTGSYTIRSAFYVGKGARTSEKMFHNCAKNFTFLRRFDCKNMFFEISRNLIRKGCF